jgi:hypothetical protein
LAGRSLIVLTGSSRKNRGEDDDHADGGHAKAGQKCDEARPRFSEKTKAGLPCEKANEDTHSEPEESFPASESSYNHKWLSVTS